MGVRATGRARRDDWDRADSENSRPKRMNPMPAGPCFIPGRRREAKRFPLAGVNIKEETLQKIINLWDTLYRMALSREG